MISPVRHTERAALSRRRNAGRHCRARRLFNHAVVGFFLSWPVLWFSAGIAFATCGSGWTEYLVPDNPLSFRFSNACVIHDKCYDTCGRDKSICDLQFYANMQAACEPVRKLGRYYKRKAQALVDKAAKRSYLNIPGRLADLSKAGLYAAEAARLAARWLTCRHLARTYYVAVDQAGRGPYCSAQKGRRCCPVPAICTSYYSCPAPPEEGARHVEDKFAAEHVDDTFSEELALTPEEDEASEILESEIEVSCPRCRELADLLRSAIYQARAARARAWNLHGDLQDVRYEYKIAQLNEEMAQHNPEELARFLREHPDVKRRYSKQELEELRGEIEDLERMTEEAHQESIAKAKRVLELHKKLQRCNEECDDVVIGADGRKWCRYGGGELVVPGGTPPGGKEEAPSGEKGPLGRPQEKESHPSDDFFPPEELPGEAPQPPFKSPEKVDNEPQRHPGSRPRDVLGPIGIGVPEGGADERPGTVERIPPTGGGQEAPPPGMTVVKASREVIEKGRRVRKPVRDAVIRLGFRPPPLPPEDAAPTPAGKAKDAYQDDPVQGVTDEKGELLLPTESFFGKTPVRMSMDLTPRKSTIVYLPHGRPVPKDLAPYVQSRGRLPGGKEDYAVLFYPEHEDGQLQGKLAGYAKTGRIGRYEENLCRDKQVENIETDSPNDPHFHSRGSWGQDYPDQWALQRLRIPQAWARLRGKALRPVVVAIIDTGIDWYHPDLPPAALWHNPREVPGNGIDDDGNGYVDDIIGWDFYHQTNLPWDYDGHGTFTAGEIAAGLNNGLGIAGINPAARLMVLKALNDFGHTRASFIAQAIQYAVDNGARIINLSVGGKGVTEIERAAIAYAVQHDVLIVVAAGNEASDVAQYSVAGLDGVLTVAATDTDDRRAFFSNWGAQVDVAAPGVDILSLRARRTDLLRDLKGIRYEPGHAYVGREKFFYRATGTSFAAPLVTGVASLLLSARPDLTAAQLRRMIIQSARDVDVPGIDQYTGYGLLDAEAALQADPEFFITARISGVRVVQEGGKLAVEILGMADADRFAAAHIEIGKGEEPTKWRSAGWKVDRTAAGPGVLARLPADAFRRAPVWSLRLIVRHSSGRRRESRFILRLE